MSTTSEGRRSVNDIRESHRTTGEPVLTATDSYQLKAMAMLTNPDFILQDELFVSTGFPDFATVSTKFSVLDEAYTVEQILAIFWGAAPNWLMVWPADQLDELLEQICKVVWLLTTVTWSRTPGLQQ